MTRPSDELTDRLLNTLVGLIAMFAAAATGWALVQIARDTTPALGISTIATLAAMVAVARLANVHMRVRATRHSTSWAVAVTVIALFVAPIPWVVISVFVGTAVAVGLMRLNPMKFLFSVAKAVCVAAAGGFILLAFGMAAPPERPLEHIAVLTLTYLIAQALDELMANPVIALATRTSVRKRFLAYWDIRLMSVAAQLVAVIVTLTVFSLERHLLLGVPPLVLSVHLWHSNRMKGRAERDAWERLAATTEALNDVDLDTVLHLGVTRAANLFSVDQVDVEAWLGEHRRLVRGGNDGIEFDGSPDDVPPGHEAVIETPLEGHDKGVRVGMLRLRFRGDVKLSEREQYTLRTFASALCTAVRNASAYAELARVATEHAHAAAHDALTGLTNRRALLERGNELLDRRNADGVLALLLIDLNHFKEVNDTLGHAAGDRVLIGVAERLSAAAGQDDVVARLGGDEFAVLLTGLPAPAVATHRAEGLLTALYKPIDVEGMRISVEACGGIAVAAGAGGMVELLRRADVAMYQAKRTGQRLATYARARDTADIGRLTLGGDLPRAVAEHQFVVNFQPIVDLASGEVVSAEALARWQHPDRGNLDPRRFLDAVERSGLLPAFADAVLDLALVAASDWREAGFDIPVAVNVSPRSLLDARFPGTVVARLRAHDMPADRLILELTETLTISQLEVVDQVLGQLRDAGVRLALDDFGTGYSSLSVLSRIPVHELKIDREFVRTMETSPEAAAVVRSTVDLGRSLNLAIVAEGVESESQRRALWELGCAAGQGHLFSRPLASSRLLAALHRGSGGRPGTLAAPLHDEGSVIRIPTARRQSKRGGGERLPHLPA